MKLNETSKLMFGIFSTGLGGFLLGYIIEKKIDSLTIFSATFLIVILTFVLIAIGLGLIYNYNGDSFGR